MEVKDMLSVSSLIEFLIDLLRDHAAQEEFANDPQGMLARHGLDSLTAQDVRDITPMLADHEGVTVKHGGSHSVLHHAGYHHDDPVRAISQITNHYEVKNVEVYEPHEYNLTYVDHRTYIDDRDTNVNVDDRDTTNIHAGGDVNVENSFNQDNDVNVIKDSYNQDNDGVDNKGGTIDHSPVAGDDIKDSLNTHKDTTATTINDSGNHVEHNSSTDVHTESDEEASHVAPLHETSLSEEPLHHEESLPEDPHPGESDAVHDDTIHDDLPHDDLAAAAAG
jgi:hypothetical protein